MKGVQGWVLVYRKTGKTRRFALLEAARRVHIRAAAKHGTRWLSLRPEAPSNHESACSASRASAGARSKPGGE